MPPFSIGDCIRFGWETFKKRPGILIGAFVLTMLIPSIPGILFPSPEVMPGAPPPPPTSAELIAALASLVLGIFTAMGMTTLALRAHDDIANVTIGDLWNPQPFWRYLGAQFLAAIIIFVGLLLLIVPGFIAALGLLFVPYVVIDRGAGPINALKESWRITNGNKWQLFLFGLVLSGLNLVGVLLLVVGLLVTVPVTWIAVTHAYRTLASQAEA
ncbi:MAG: DUF975 family protein [Hyphomicrobium sp.]